MAIDPKDKDLKPLENLISLLSDPKEGSRSGSKRLSNLPKCDESEQDRLILLSIEPHFAFAYWNICPSTIEEAASHVGLESKLTLRFYDITSGNMPDSESGWDIEVFDSLGNWYIRLDYPEQVLAMDIGLKDSTGRYCTISRTHAVKLSAVQMDPAVSLENLDSIALVDATGDSGEDAMIADHNLMKQILGPHFYGLLMKGNFESIVGSSAEAVFQDIASIKQSDF